MQNVHKRKTLILALCGRRSQSDGAALPRRPQMGISPAAEYLLA